MGVYIKDMRMPTNCLHCPLWMKCKVIDLVKRPDGCPLVEVAEPHGRLIDADELLSKHLTKWTCYDAERIGTAPTVIEAEGE